MAQVPDDVVVVFDEAYFEYLDDPPDTLRFVREGRNVIILRTFSKIHGLANLRLGYGIARPELIQVVQKTRAPFNTNGVAQAGARGGAGRRSASGGNEAMTDEGRKYLEREFAGHGSSFHSERRKFRPR